MQIALILVFFGALAAGSVIAYARTKQPAALGMLMGLVLGCVGVSLGMLEIGLIETSYSGPDMTEVADAGAAASVDIQYMVSTKTPAWYISVLTFGGPLVFALSFVAFTATTPRTQ